MVATYASLQDNVADGDSYNPPNATDGCFCWCFFATRQAAAPTYSAHDWDGNALTATVDDLDYDPGSGDLSGFLAHYEYGTADPAAGTISVTQSSANTAEFNTVIELAGVHQTTPIPATNGWATADFTAQTTPATLSFDAPAGCVVVYIIHADLATTVTLSGWTERIDAQYNAGPLTRTRGIYTREYAVESNGETVAATLANSGDGYHAVLVFASADVSTESAVDAATGEVNYEGFANTSNIELLVSGALGEVNFDGFATSIENQKTSDFATGLVNYDGFSITAEVLKAVSAALGVINYNGFNQTTDLERAVAAALGDVNYNGFNQTSTVESPTIAVIAGLGILNYAGFAHTSGIERAVNALLGYVNADGFDQTSTVELAEILVNALTGEVQYQGLAATMTVEEVISAVLEGAGSGRWREYYERLPEEDREMLDVIREFLTRTIH